MKKRDGLQYAVSFDTREVPGRIACVTVALDKTFIGMDDKIRVDLRDHPLYAHLQEYVLDNPVPRLKPKGGKT